MEKTIELCEGCKKEYHAAFLTDDGIWLCSACYIELLKSELTTLKTQNTELRKMLQSAEKATESLPIDALDTVPDHPDYGQGWPIREELLSNIKSVLKKTVDERP